VGKSVEVLLVREEIWFEVVPEVERVFAVTEIASPEVVLCSGIVAMSSVENNEASFLIDHID
jgi:hypothetical protein